MEALIAIFLALLAVAFVISNPWVIVIIWLIGLFVSNKKDSNVK